jgi:predicted Zn-dependent protease
MFLSAEEAGDLARRTVAKARAPSCFVWLTGRDSRNMRFASRGGATNGAMSGADVTVVAAFGQRRGRASANAIDEDSLNDAVARAESAARDAPENPEVMPALEKQTYPRSTAYDEATALMNADLLADLLLPAVRRAAQAGADLAGFASAQRSWRAFATSAGGGGYDRATGIGLSLSVRNRRGTWSGWSGTDAYAALGIDAEALARAAIDKALAQPDPVVLEPGKYTVLLEPAVVGQFVAEMMWRAGARFADEGRSFFTRRGGGTKVGETVFAPGITLTSDPADARAPGFAFDGSGLPHDPVTWIDQGKLATLKRDRYWAKRTGLPPVADYNFYTLAGGSDSQADMIRSVKHGVLVTRLWYVRMVDPRAMLLTGLTRDGTFLIENGAIAGPCTNFRFNESPITVLRNVLGRGPTTRAAPPEAWTTLSVPPLLVEDFTFSSISPAV